MATDLKSQISNLRSRILLCPSWRVAAATVLAVVLAVPAAAAPTFDRDVKPIFERRCSSCHGEEKQRGGLNLATLADVMKGGEDGAVVVPGKSDESLMIKLLEHREKPFMP